MTGLDAPVRGRGSALTGSVARSRIVQDTRAREWWVHKLAPTLATGYATAYFLDVALTEIWSVLLCALVALTAAAAYVSLINDFTDRAVDRRAGKPNRLEGRSTGYAVGAIAMCCLVGLGIALLAWPQDPLANALYAGSWIAFSLYSFPPIRLKGRGVTGAIADASGAHLFPNLLVAVAVFHASDRQLSPTWIALVGVWSLAHGLRGAIWHQLGDVQADRASNVQSFGATSPGAAMRVVHYVLFPVEVLALCALVSISGSAIVFGALVLSQIIELTRARQWFLTIAVAGSSARRRHALHEFYVVYFPLGFLVAAGVREPLAFVVLAMHVVLFWPTCAQAAAEAYRVLRSALAGHADWLARSRAPQRINTWSANAVVNSSEPKPVSSSLPPK